jgi:hypothetical protein
MHFVQRRAFRELFRILEPIQNLQTANELHYLQLIHSTKHKVDPALHKNPQKHTPPILKKKKKKKKKPNILLKFPSDNFTVTKNPFRRTLVSTICSLSLPQVKPRSVQ